MTAAKPRQHRQTAAKPRQHRQTLVVDHEPVRTTCARCGSACVMIPHSDAPKGLHGFEWYEWMAEAAKGICLHCSLLPVEKWPDYFHGRLVKPCGCGSATCPVPAYAEVMETR